MTKKKSVTPVELPEVAEVIPAPVVLPEPVRVHVAQAGDTYPSIAGLYKPSTVTKHEYAMHLFELNKGKALTPGTEVSL